MTESDGRTTGKRRRGGRSGPTVVDVAERAGVSPMTVSRVINGDKNVLAATRQKVADAVRALGYVPNLAARSLAGGQHCRIALLHSNPSAAYLSEFLVGCLAEAELSNAQLTVEPVGDEDGPEAIVERLIGHRIDATLLPPPLCDDQALLAALHATGMPIAQVATGRPAAFAHAVAIDDEAAAHAITAHLVAEGHRRIGFISGDPKQTASALRHDGYRRALREAGIAAEDAWIVGGDFTYRSGLIAAETLLGADARPTAVFACNDDMAAAVIAVAHRHQLDVPGDLSIAGYDDTPIATTVWPELTTARQPICEMARLAMRLLIDAVSGRLICSGEDVRHETLPFELRIRSSTATLEPRAAGAC